jgi:hypothetical protein
MGYRITTITGSASGNRAAAEFLAAFVRDGELTDPREGDDLADVWQQRMRWWWDENPFCREDSPRGFLLRDEDDDIVGFNGLIPFDYEVDGEIVASLVTTTFFVRERHRSAVMGMLTRQRALSQQYHMIDGSPSPEMRRLLVKLGYERSGDRFQYLFPTNRLGGPVARACLKALGWCLPLPPASFLQGYRVTNDPEKYPTGGAWPEGILHRRLDPDSLHWLSSVGSEPRQFFGLIDEAGDPVAHVIGVYKSRFGVKACLLLDFHDHHEDGAGIGLLIRKLLEHPAQSGLDAETAILLYSRFTPDPEAPGLRRVSLLHYQLPVTRPGVKKVCLPIEGDLHLL